MAAADGADAGAVLLNHAVQLTTGASDGNQVLEIEVQAACILLFQLSAPLSQLLLHLCCCPKQAANNSWV